MLLSKDNLAVAAFASKDETRLSLGGVYVEPDGTTVATNGRYLATVGPCHADRKDFPDIPGMNPETTTPGEQSLKAFVLPADDAKAIAKALPKGRTINTLPILAHAVVDVAHSNENGTYRIGVTDLERPQIFQGRKVEGEFPDYRQVLPKGDPAWIVGLSAAYLKDIAATALSLGVKHLKVEGFETDANSVKPVRFTGTTGSGQDFYVVLMPARL